MSWATFEQYSAANLRLKSMERDYSPLQPKLPEITEAVGIDKSANKLSTNSHWWHPRRTLDQFYYPALNDTSDRDADQTISKWSGKKLPPNGRDKAVDDSLLIMVDQLWCWVLDDSVSFF